MGVKHAREYRDIHKELTEALTQVREMHEFFEMTQSDWDELSKQERLECVRTMADDVFYALGTDPVIEIGRGSVTHDPARYLLLVRNENRLLATIHLI
ncbi:hypothetical protein ACFQWB_02925 [Paenibacillus thermoaerophilus]|uniref:Uncharacterized protein n=1 Tax=Paenibacillus thermoaerophilus TaxID=1215385 RepID=A0ABW2V1N8_9BACL|nr:hypothetical protein [Paenibacillus thermoaerophilus]TMV17731.1 hypothetical protein FE781_06270 [Paenibacillus thermoaerophilus]